MKVAGLLVVFFGVLGVCGAVETANQSFGMPKELIDGIIAVLSGVLGWLIRHWLGDER